MTNKEQYLEICDQKNDLPLFHKAWWLDIVLKSWDVALVKNGDKITGVWPYGIERKLGISLSRNPALTSYLGPHVFFPADMNESKRDNYEYKIIEELIGKLPAIKVWYTACRPGLKQAGLFQEHLFGTHFRQTFLMDLKEDEQSIFARLHEDFRRSIRKSANEMTISNEPDALGLLFDFHVARLARKQVISKLSKETIYRLFEAGMAHAACALWVVRKEGEIQAILWNLWDDERAYYLVGGKNPNVKDNHAMTAVIWHAIKHSKNLGKSSFDFDGSMIPGVERFFRNFGGRRELYPVLQRNDSVIWRIIKMLRP